MRDFFLFGFLSSLCFSQVHKPRDFQWFSCYVYRRTSDLPISSEWKHALGRVFILSPVSSLSGPQNSLNAFLFWILPNCLSTGVWFSVTSGLLKASEAMGLWESRLWYMCAEITNPSCSISPVLQPGRPHKALPDRGAAVPSCSMSQWARRGRVTGFADAFIYWVWSDGFYCVVWHIWSQKK